MTARRRAPVYRLPAAWFVTLCGVLCFGLKLHYSLASADTLRWILTPTSWLVEIVGAGEFEFESGVGFVNRQQLVAITKACAGVNFFILAFAVLGLSTTALVRKAADVAVALAGTLLVSFCLTVVENAVRISMAIHLQAEHQLEGMLLYFGSLILLHATATRYVRRRLRAGRSVTTRGGTESSKPFPSLSSPLVPFTLYVLLMVAVPLFNGVTWDGMFFQHVTLLMVVAGLLTVLYALAAAGRGRPDRGHGVSGANEFR